MSRELDFFENGSRNWKARLSVSVEMMRELSRHTDAQVLTRVYTQRMTDLFPIDRQLSLSRRGLEKPWVRITRYSSWQEEIPSELPTEQSPLVQSHLLAQLVYGDEPVIVDDLQLEPDDPAQQYLAGQRSLLAIPHFEQGSACTMVVVTRAAPAAFSREKLPELVWMSNLFGRTVQTLILSEQLQHALDAVDAEMQRMAMIQQSLLPQQLPEIPGLDVAVHYQTTRRAGGDYYDFFPLADGRWGLLIADVSGHGTPAAVLMAITHSLAHTYTGPPAPAGLLLQHINRHLTARYTRTAAAFVTAFYAVYDPATAMLTFVSAGHTLPRWLRSAAGTSELLPVAPRLPLGIFADEIYPERQISLAPGDCVVLLTDGITEALSPEGEPFDLTALERGLQPPHSTAAQLRDAVLLALDRHTHRQPLADDRTLLVLRRRN